MAQEKDLIEFDDQDAIAFILKNLDKGVAVGLSDDAVQYVLDLICDYYEQNNLFEEDSDEVAEASIAEDDMFNFISAAVKKEKVVELTADQIQAILEGEYAYGVSIGIYSDED